MWDMTEAVAYYRRQGAPGDQSALVSLLREAQSENGGGIPKGLLPQLAELLDVKESYLLAVVKRIPSLRIADIHILELCGGPNCTKRAKLENLRNKAKGI